MEFLYLPTVNNVYQLRNQEQSAGESFFSKCCVHSKYFRTLQAGTKELFHLVLCFEIERILEFLEALSSWSFAQQNRQLCVQAQET